MTAADNARIHSNDYSSMPDVDRRFGARTRMSPRPGGARSASRALSVSTRFLRWRREWGSVRPRLAERAPIGPLPRLLSDAEWRRLQHARSHRREPAGVTGAEGGGGVMGPRERLSRVSGTHGRRNELRACLPRGPMVPTMPGELRTPSLASRMRRCLPRGPMVPTMPG